MKFKVIKTSPEFKIGDIIESKDYSWNPELYPHLFKKQTEDYYTTKDDVEVTYSTPVYVIENSQIIFLSLGIRFIVTELIFSTEEAAKKYLLKFIKIKLEDKIVEGENILIYGVCCISNWQLNTSTSLKLFQRRVNSLKESEHWKWFSTEYARDEYIKNNKPLYNLNQLISFGQYCYTNFDKSKNDTIEEFLGGCLDKIIKE